MTLWIFVVSMTAESVAALESQRLQYGVSIQTRRPKADFYSLIIFVTS